MLKHNLLPLHKSKRKTTGSLQLLMQQSYREKGVVRGAGRKCKYRRLEIIHLAQSIPEIQTMLSEIQKHKEAYIIRAPFFFFLPFSSSPAPHCTRTHNIYLENELFCGGILTPVQLFRL